jgi:hypothetical protein
VARDLRQVEKKGPGGHDHSELYKDAYELFRETQHLQPDVGAIQIYLNEKLGRDVCSEVVKYKATDTQNTWIPAFDKPQQKVIPQFIAAKVLRSAAPSLVFNYAMRRRGWGSSRRWASHSQRGPSTWTTWSAWTSRPAVWRTAKAAS